MAVIKKIGSIVKDVEKREPLCTVGGNVLPPKIKNRTTM